MQVRTLFFASYRDLVGASTLELRLPEGSTVSDLVGRIRERGGGYGSLPADPAVAVNREYASSDVALRDGDEVAFIPPVAGG